MSDIQLPPLPPGDAEGLYGDYDMEAYAREAVELDRQRLDRQRLIHALSRARAGISMWESGHAFDPHGPARDIQRAVDDALAGLELDRQQR